MNVVLIGYRGVGKTTVGRALASALTMSFVDCDEQLEAQAHQSIGQVLSERGEAAFRVLEHEVLIGLAPSANTVVATGGGVILDSRHAALLRQLGDVVWLVARAETIQRRIGQSSRPPLTSLPAEEEIRLHLRERTQLYAAAARHVVDTDDRTVAQVVELVARQVGATASVLPGRR